MHAGTNAGIVSSRRVAMAALPHTPYAMFWFSIVALSDLSGVIAIFPCMLPASLSGSGECNREVQIHAGCAIICLCLVLILCGS
jgi:hypothetical protein